MDLTSILRNAGSSIDIKIATRDIINTLKHEFGMDFVHTSKGGYVRGIMAPQKSTCIHIKPNQTTIGIYLRHGDYVLDNGDRISKTMKRYKKEVCVSYNKYSLNHKELIRLVYASIFMAYSK